MPNVFKSKRAIMKELLDNKHFLNGTLVTEDGGSFQVHVEFVAAMSPYFHRRIMAAKIVPETHLIPGVSKEVLANIVNFIYTLKIELCMDTVVDVSKAAALLEMPAIIKVCREHVLTYLNNMNCIKIFMSANEMPNPGIKEEIKPYILRNFQQIFPISSDYLNLSIDDVTCLLQSDDLNVTSEESAFWAILRWVEHDLDNRLQHLPNLLRCIRFGFCTSQFYQNIVQNNLHIQSSEDCQDILLQASEMFADITSGPPDQQSNMLLDRTHPFMRPRIPNEIIFVMGGWSSGSATNVIETFDVKSGRWFLSLNPDSIPRAYHGMLWHKGYIYVIGGFDGNQCFNDVRRYDPVSNLWEEKGCMYEQRCYVSVAALDDYIFAMGGYDGQRRSKTCERFDPETNQWQMMASMNFVRSDACATTLDGKIYIAGGFNGQAVLNSAECYDPQTDEWTDITAMSSPRSGVRLATYNGFLFLIGGFDGNMRLASVQKYDTRTKQWSSVADMNGPRSNFAVAVIYDCLYVIGGFNGFSTVSAAECYDHRKNEWVLITELNLNRSALAACTVTDIPNSSQYTFLGNVPLT